MWPNEARARAQRDMHNRMGVHLDSSNKQNPTATKPNPRRTRARCAAYLTSAREVVYGGVINNVRVRPREPRARLVCVCALCGHHVCALVSLLSLTVFIQYSGYGNIYVWPHDFHNIHAARHEHNICSILASLPHRRYTHPLGSRICIKTATV